MAAVNSRGLTVQMLDCGLDVSELELELRSLYNVHFRTNEPSERFEYFYTHSYGFNDTSTIFLLGCLWH